MPSAPTYPTLQGAREAFAESLIAKSPRTAANYLSALNRFFDFLPKLGLDSESSVTNQLPADILEKFYTWLLRRHGREGRSTAITYAAEVRAFIRFLDRRAWLAPDVSFERMKSGLGELIGRQNYKTPRVDDAIADVVVAVGARPVPPPDDHNLQERLALLRDKALLTTLYATGMRREEVSRLNRTDIQDGRVGEGLVTGKGDKERVVFFDDPSLAAIQAYLAARADDYLPLFLRHDRARGRPGVRGERWRLSPRAVWEIVRTAGQRTGVRATTHHLRHLKARIMLNAGAQLSEVQDILGHASPETTKKIYAQYTTSHLRDAFDRFSLPAEEVARRARRPGTRPARDPHQGSEEPGESGQ